MTERINIRRLQTVERDRRSFDVNRDLDDKDWTRINEYTQRMKKMREWPTVFLRAAAVEILGKHDPSIDEEAWSGIEEQLNKFWIRSNEAGYIFAAASMNTIDRSRTPSIEARLWSSAQDTVHSDYNNGHFMTSSALALAMKVISPSLNVLRPEQLHRMHQHLGTLYEKQLMFDYALLAANLKLLGESLDISAEVWELLRKQLQIDRSYTGDPDRFLLTAERLHILATGQTLQTKERIQQIPETIEL